LVSNVDNTVYYGGSGKSLKLSNGGVNIGHNWKYDSNSEFNSGDFTMTFSIYQDTVTDASGANRCGVLLSGNSAGTTGYIVLVRPTAGNTNIRLSRFSGGAETVIITADYGSTFLANTWYRVKVYMNGTTMRVRVWKDGDSEPSTWLIDTTDATYDNTNKKTGFYYFNGTTSTMSSWLDSVAEV
jgi:hypothetical protein